MDYGGKRIGLAVASAEAALPRALRGLAAAGSLERDAVAIVGRAREEQAGVVVLGLPLLEGQETRMSSVCRRLAVKIEALGMPVALVDESLTSADADAAMAAAGLKGAARRKRVDGEAACRILSRHLGAQRG